MGARVRRSCARPPGSIHCPLRRSASTPGPQQTTRAARTRTAEHDQTAREPSSQVKSYVNLLLPQRLAPPPHSDDIEKWLKLKQLTYNKKYVFNFHI